MYFDFLYLYPFPTLLPPMRLWKFWCNFEISPLNIDFLGKQDELVFQKTAQVVSPFRAQKTQGLKYAHGGV